MWKTVLPISVPDKGLQAGDREVKVFRAPILPSAQLQYADLNPSAEEHQLIADLQCRSKTTLKHSNGRPPNVLFD